VIDETFLLLSKNVCDFVIFKFERTFFHDSSQSHC